MFGYISESSNTQQNNMQWAFFHMVGKVPDIWPLKIWLAASKNSVNLTADHVHQNFGSYSLSALK